MRRHVLENDLYESFRHQRVAFLIAGIHAQPLHALDRGGRLDRYGRENFVADVDHAIVRAAEILGAPSAGPGRETGS